MSSLCYLSGNFLIVITLVLTFSFSNKTTIRNSVLSQGNSYSFQLVSGKDSVLKEVETRKYIVSSNLSKSLKVVSEDGFRITSMEVTLARGTALVRSVESKSAIMPRVISSLSVPGDRLLIKIKGVLKPPYNDSTDKVNVGNVVLQVDFIE